MLDSVVVQESSIRMASAQDVLLCGGNLSIKVAVTFRHVIERPAVPMSLIHKCAASDTRAEATAATATLVSSPPRQLPHGARKLNAGRFLRMVLHEMPVFTFTRIVSRTDALSSERGRLAWQLDPPRLASTKIGLLLPKALCLCGTKSWINYSWIPGFLEGWYCRMHVLLSNVQASTPARLGRD